MAFEPGRGIGQVREAGRMRFGKTILAKTLDLLEDTFEIRFLVAVVQHAVVDLVAKRFQAAFALPRRHRAAQLIGFAGREVGDDFDQAHHLFLENRHAERAFQHVLHP